MEENNEKNILTPEESKDISLEAFKLELKEVIEKVKEEGKNKKGMYNLSELRDYMSSPFDVEGMIKGIEAKMGIGELEKTPEYKEKAREMVQQALEKLYGQKIDFKTSEKHKEEKPSNIQDIDKREKPEVENQKSTSVENKEKREVKDFGSMVREQAKNMLSPKGSSEGKGLAEWALTGGSELDRYNPANRYVREKILEKLNIEKLIPNKKAAKAMQELIASKGIDALDRNTALEMFDEPIDIEDDNERAEIEKVSNNDERVEKICKQEDFLSRYEKEPRGIKKFFMGFMARRIEKKKESTAAQKIRKIARQEANKDLTEDSQEKEGSTLERTKDRIEDGLEKYDALSEVDSIARETLEIMSIGPDEKSLEEFCRRPTNSQEISRMLAVENEDINQDKFGEIPPPVSE